MVSSRVTVVRQRTSTRAGYRENGARARKKSQRDGLARRASEESSPSLARRASELARVAARFLQIAGVDAVKKDVGERRSVLLHRDPADLIDLPIGHTAQLAPTAGGGQLVIVASLAHELAKAVLVPGEN